MHWLNAWYFSSAWKKYGILQNRKQILELVLQHVYPLPMQTQPLTLSFWPGSYKKIQSLYIITDNSFPAVSLNWGWRLFTCITAQTSLSKRENNTA